MERFDDKVVLITGAGRGIGRATAEAFARLGACLALNDLTPINLDVTLERVRALGAPARDYICDMSKQMPVESMVSQALADWGRIDALVYCAGVRPGAALFALDEWDWRHTLDINLSGPFFSMQIAGRAMQRQGGGAMVFFAADATRPQAAAGNVAFAASKMGLIGLAQQAARELAGDHIRVNVICPAEDIFASAETTISGPQTGPQTDADLEPPVGEVLRLCAPSAAHITGQVVYL